MDPQTIRDIALAGLHQSDDVQIVAAVMAAVVLIVVPAIFLDYRIKARRAQAASPGDQRAVQELWQTAQRMETRIGYLERVLDTEVPGWRSRSEMR